MTKPEETLNKEEVIFYPLWTTLCHGKFSSYWLCIDRQPNLIQNNVHRVQSSVFLFSIMNIHVSNAFGFFSQGRKLTKLFHEPKSLG